MWDVWYYLSCQSFREKYIFRRFACCWPPQCVITNDHFLVIRNTFRSVSKRYLVLAFCLFPPSATWFEISPVSVFKGGGGGGWDARISTVNGKLWILVASLSYVIYVLQNLLETRQIPWKKFTVTIICTFSWNIRALFEQTGTVRFYQASAPFTNINEGNQLS